MQQNAIIGDSTGTDLPKMEVDEKQLMEEKRMAQYAKSPEFQKIKLHFEERIKFYQNYLPDGRPIVGASQTDREGAWVIANAIIAELNAILGTYAQVTEAVENAQK
jgi:hypothetical protein